MRTLIVVVVSCLVGACVPERDLDSQLVVAAREGNATKVLGLISDGANVNGTETVEGIGRSALYHASAEGSVEVVKLLISRGARVDEQPPGRPTALISASFRGHTEVVRVLLAAGASPNAVGEYGWTALATAARNGHVEIIRLLIGHGADVNHRLADGSTALGVARAHKQDVIADELSKAGGRS